MNPHLTLAPMLRFKQIAGIVFNTFFFAVTLFVPAGTIRWPRAWIFLGVVFVGTAVTRAWRGAAA